MEIAIPDTLEAYKALSKDEKKAVFTKIWEEGRQDEVMGKWNLPKGPFTTMAVRLGVTEGNPITKQRREKAKAKKMAQVAVNDPVPAAVSSAEQDDGEQAPAPKKTRRTSAKSNSTKVESKIHSATESPSRVKSKRASAKKEAQKPEKQSEPEIAVNNTQPEAIPPTSAASANVNDEQLSISVAEFTEMKSQIKKLSAVVDVLFDKINDLEKRQWK